MARPVGFVQYGAGRPGDDGHRTREDQEMKKTAAFLGAALLAAATPKAAEPTVADRFGWMVGCWTGHRGPATFTEIWTGGGPDLLVGMSVTTIPGRAAEFE